MINLKNITKYYDEGDSKLTVLSNLDLSIKKGEIIILLGKSGSGKSTLLNIISGIDIPNSGSIQINSEEITSLSEKERTLVRRKKIGFIFQFFNLVPTLTVKENLVLPLELNHIENR
ncbi:MAG: ATP-binding cassette domain-containing protein, partial [Melioribacteraceae bacterium]|nr:ATP-binding cassette domain-containing protein [Melioribacteraceae bacterium]